MRDFLIKLSSRLRDAITRCEDGDEKEQLHDAARSLTLAESAIDKVALCRQYPKRPLQLVIAGPTQVGKSSMVNWLLQRQLAEASPIAGHTVHMQGYAIATRSEGDVRDQKWAASFFHDQAVRSQQALKREILDEYSIADINDPSDELFTNTVVWDTPDFDSVKSLTYRRTVLRAVALADLVVFVVSKEKYADKSVWEFLALLHQLNKPVLVVMNKTSANVREELAASFTQKYSRLLTDNDDELSQATPLLQFLDDFGSQPAAANDSPEVVELRQVIYAELGQLEAVSRDCETLGFEASRFMNLHWSQWTAPLDRQYQLKREWKAMVDGVADDMQQRYVNEYLDHSRYRETFQLALAELLVLLEVPGMAEPLGKIRSLVTWPVRKLLSSTVQRQADLQDKDERTEERRVLDELGVHALTKLAGQISRAEDDRKWQPIEKNLAERNDIVLRKYQGGLDNYQTLLQVEIERAAQSLYRRLQEQPATLNSLRAARVSADAAAVVLAVKSGGLGAADLIIAPAMLSLTTMLTEGALGKYMQTVQDGLRRYQEKQVGSVINRTVRVPLYSISAGIDQTNGPEVTETELQAAREMLERGDV